MLALSFPVPPPIFISYDLYPLFSLYRPVRYDLEEVLLFKDCSRREHAQERLIPVGARILPSEQKARLLPKVVEARAARSLLCTQPARPVQGIQTLGSPGCGL